LERIVSTFTRFLDWRLPERARGRLSGDPLCSLHLDWEMWLTCVADDDQRRIIALFQSVETDLITQRGFLEWLSTLDGFRENAVELALFQLVQCKGFHHWSELIQRTNPVPSLARTYFLQKFSVAPAETARLNL